MSEQVNVPKFCTKCGAALSFGSNFCGKCGARVINRAISQPVYTNIADKLRNSKWYNQYQVCFNSIIRYNDGIKKQVPYKIDWLLETLDSGVDLGIDWVYVKDSMEADFPYYCESEAEYDLLRNRNHDNPVLQGDIHSVISLARNYKTGVDLGDYKIYKHKSKFDYWMNTVKRWAEEGNLYAQAALASPYESFRVLTDDERQSFSLRYEAALVEKACQGNHVARLAIALFLSSLTQTIEPDGWDRNIILQDIAVKGNLSDAWYHLAKVTRYLYPADATQEEKDRHERLFWVYLKNGAKANNGVMAGYCQYMTAIITEDDNPEEAKHWYELALSNGQDVQYSLDWANKRLSGQV